MKHLKLFFTLLTLVIFGCGQMWGGEVSWAFKTLQTTSGTQDGITWETGKTGSANATTCNSTNGLVLYGVSNGGGYFQTTSAISGTITNVNIVSTNKKNTPKYSVYCSTDGSNWTAIATNQEAGTNDHPVTGSYTYVKVANTTAATAQLGVTSITISYAATTPSYTITAQSNDESKGTVSLSGSVITGSPKAGFRYASPAYSVSPANSATVSQNGDEFTVTPSANTTVTINFEAIPTHTVTWSANGNTSNTSDFAEGAAIEFPESASGCDGKTFVGWSASTINGETDEAPSFVTSATMGNNNITYYAVFADVVPGDDSWELTALADLTSSDVFVMGSDAYAIPNNGGTSAPTVAAITVADNKITSAVADNFKWNVSGNATNGYTFYPNGTTESWLYCSTTAASSSNNNIAIGTGARKVWELDNSGYLITKDTYTARYLSIYSNQDFRGYVNTSNGAFVFKCYKFVKGGSASGYATSCCQKYAVNIANNIQNGTITANPTSACADAKVTLTATPATGYQFSAWNVAKAQGTVDVDNNNQFTMPGEAVTVSATFAAKHHYVVFHKNDGGEDVTANQDFAYGQTQNLTANAWSRGEDYSFNGWNTLPTGLGTPYSDGQSFTLNVDANVDLYAQWLENTSHAVSYSGDAHIASYSVKPIKIAEDAEELTAEFALETGYKVTAVAATINGVAVDANNIAFDNTMVYITSTGFAGDVVITFTIEEIIYTVTFDKGTGICNTESLTQASYNANIELPAATPSVACADEEYGWTFAGWKVGSAVAEKTSDAQTLLTAGSKYKPESNVTLYAVYQIIEASDATVTKSMTTFDAISGNVDGDANIGYVAAQGDASTAPVVNTNEIRIYQNGGLLTITANNGTKLNSITIGSSMATSVTYSIDGGTASEEQSIEASGTTTINNINATTVVFTCTGTDKNSRLYLNSLNVTYSGIGVANYLSNPSCNPKYNVNIAAGIENGNVYADKAKACADETVTLTATPDPHYHLDAWTVAKSVGTVTPSPNATTTPATFSMPGEAVTVSATFAIDHHNVVFHKNFGEGDVTSTQDFAYGESKNLAAKSEGWTRDGYNFGGWMNDAEGTEADYANEASFTMGDAEVHLYALWLSNTIHPIAYTANEHITAYPTQPATVDKDDASIAVAFTLETGYKVTGVTIMMGESELTSGVSYTQSTLTINKPEGGFTDNISITFAINEIVYTVTFNKGTGVCATESLTQEHYNTNIQLPAATASAACAVEDYGWTFAGWAEAAVATETSDAQTLLAAGDNYKPGSDITLYAVYQRSESGETPETKYISAALSDLTSSDVFVIVGNNGSNYAMSNDKGTSNPPAATAVTIEGNKITGEVADALKWNISGNATDGYTFYPNGSTTTWLYCTAANNGVRVGTNENKTFTVVGGYLKHSETSRYVGVYNSSDWRCYTSSSTNINDQTFAFYKATEVYPTTSYYLSSPTCATKYTITVDGEIANGSVAVSPNVAKATAGTALTLTATPVENVSRFKQWDVTGMELSNEQKATSPLNIEMPASNLTVSATFDALYAITKELENGTFNLDKNYAIEGEIVTISNISANAQYKDPVLEVYYVVNEVKTIVSLTQDGDNYTFEMPAHAVKAKVTCSPALVALAAPVLGDPTNATYQGVTLNWEHVANNNGYVLTVQQGGENVEGFVNVDIPQNATSYTIESGLTVNTAYTYSIYTKGDGENTLAENTPVNGAFNTAAAYPTATLTLSEVGGDDYSIDANSHKLFDIVKLPSALKYLGCNDGKVLVGWTNDANFADTDEEPTSNYWAKGADYTIASTADKLYAVYVTAEAGADPEPAYTLALTKNTSNSAYGTYYTVTVSEVGWSIPGNQAIADYVKIGGNNSITERHLYSQTAISAKVDKVVVNHGAKDAAITVSGLKLNVYSTAALAEEGGNGDISSVSATYVAEDNVTFNCPENDDWTGRFYRLDYTMSSSATSGNKGLIINSVKMYPKAEVSYEGYTISCTAALPEPIATPTPAALENIAAAGANGTIAVTYENVNTAALAVALFNDAECSEAFTGAWLSVDFDNGDIDYTIAENTSYNDARTAYIKLTAPETTGATDPAVVIIPVSQAKKAAVFSSLEELVAAGVNANTNVTVEFSNVVIKDIYYYPDNTSENNRKGLVFDIQKADQDIKIYYNAQVPTEWVAGGKVSGTLTNCPWKIYSNAWQLAPTSGFVWGTDLSYTAPAEVSTVVVSGAPAKTTYVDGEKLNPAGLSVRVNYTDETYEDNPVGVTFSEVVLHEGDTEADITATFGTKTSDAYTVTDLTVGAVQPMSIAAFIAAGGARCYLEGIVSNYSNKTKGYFDLTDASGTIYIYGCDQPGEFAEGDKIKVLAEEYLYYNNETHEAKNVQFVSKVSPVEITITSAATVEKGKTLNLTANTDPAAGADHISYSIKTGSESYVSLSDKVLTGVEIGEATIIASVPNGEGYIANSVEFTVEVTAPVVHASITYEENGGSVVEDVADATNLPNPLPKPTKEGFIFAGWFTTSTFDENTEAEAGAALAEDITLYAKWNEGSEFEWVAADKGYENAQDIATATEEADPISIVFAKETAQNGPKYYTSGTAVRTYAGNTVTIATKSDTKLINKITFTYGDKNVVADGLSEDKLTWTGLAKEVVLTTFGGQAHYKTINVTYINGTVTTLAITDINLKLSDGKTALSITKNVDATIIYEGLDESVATIANNKVTPVAEGSTTVTARIAQGANYTAAQTTFTITVAAKTIPVMSFPQAEYNANLGGSFTAPTLTKPEGVTVTYSSDNAVVSVDENTGAITINAEGTAVITATSEENNDYAVGTASYTLNVVDPNKDVLTADAIEAGSSYKDWSNKTFGSSVKYAGNSMTASGANAGAIQMRVQNPSGIVTTSAIGYLKSISATAHTGNAKTLEIYAKGSAYESSADLYSNDEAVKGVKIGTIGADGGAMVFETGKAYSDNYKYIGIKANGGAVYYDEITITWTPAVFEHFDVTYKAGEATGDDIVESIEEGSNISLKAADTFEAPEGKIFAGWLLTGEENVREAGSKYTVTAAATFTAQWISVYTITYTAGEGTGDDVVVENVPIGNYELAANTFTAPENKEFAGWKLNNAGETLAAGSNFTVGANASFTAQWSIVKQAAGLAYATTSYMITRGRSFEAPELTNPNGLTVAYSGNNDEVATVDAATGALTLKGVVGEVTVTATSAETDYYYAGEASYTLKVKDANLAGGWVRLNASSELINGMKVIIAEYVASGEDIYAMGAQNANNRGQVAGTLEEGKLVADEGTAIFTLVKVGEAANTYALKTADNKYLYAASSSSNHLKSQANIDGNATWTISLSADGKATITAQGTNSHNLMRYNSDNGIFSCYTGNQQDIALYSKTVGIVGNTDVSTLEDYADVVVTGQTTLTIDSDKPLGNVTVTYETKIDNTVNPLKTEALNIQSKYGYSGQILDAANITSSSFYIDYNFYNPEVEPGEPEITTLSAEDAEYWYSICSPFAVNLNGGICQTDGTPMVFGQDFDLFEYDGSKRSETGVTGWKRAQGVMPAGVACLIGFNEGQPTTIRLKKDVEMTNVTSIALYGENNATPAANENWNGVGNPTLRHIDIDQDVQVYDNNVHGYQAYSATSYSFVVNTPFFLQRYTSAEIAVSDASHSQLRAPQRMSERYEFCVRINKAGKEQFDNQMYVRASETANAEFEAGHDMITLNGRTSKNAAMIWTENYGGKRLAIEEAPLINDQASYELGLYAPKNGEYRIEVASPKEDADLYLTREGAIIWNLSESAYTIDLTKGVNTGYGLLLKAKMPQTPTGIENGGMLNGANGVQKVIIDENVFILRGGQMYDVTGKAVK